VQGRSRHLPLCGLVSLLAVLAAISAAPAFAKLPRTYQVTRIDSPEPQGTSANRVGDRFGDNIMNAGDDFDDDTKDDLLVGIDRRGLIKGKLLLLDGITGSLIYSVEAPSDDIPTDPTQDGLPGDDPAGFGAAIAIGDFGHCEGGSPGIDCGAPQGDQNVPDGHPDFVASAPGLDLETEGDDRGAVFVIDGPTGAILKRIRPPVFDSNGTGFGRSLLVPMGEPPCGGIGKAGIGKCDYSPGSPSVVSGDLDDAGKPDIVIGSPDYNETSASNDACSDGAGGGTCSRAGRVYVYYGEDLAVGAPSTFQSNPRVTLKNPYAQHDAPSLDPRYWAESMGASLAPVGDLGTCTESVLPAQFSGPAPFCSSAAKISSPDGQPEFMVSVPGEDAGAIPDAGLAFTVDGRTGRIIDTYADPEPQAGALFGFSNSNRPALGDAGGPDTLPDLYLPAIGQTVQQLGQGRGFVFSGRITVDASSHLFSVLDDPTPFKFGNFGTSSAGLGNVAGDSRKEILVGAYAPQGSNPGSESLINDVHIFSPLNDQVLQTVFDPDHQPGSGFGRGLAPLGDLNDDGLLDFALGAGGYDSSSPNAVDRGRVYLFMSDDSPLPTTPPPAKPPTTSGTGPTPTTTTQTLAGRALELEANKTRIFSGTRILLRGAVEAFTRKARCEQNQVVEIQRRRRGTIRYATVGRVRTDSVGNFALRLRPKTTYFYRARVAQTAFCIGAVSPREQVVVRKKGRSASR
jgi:hypothetical protein